MSYYDRDDDREPPLPKPYGFVALPTDRPALCTPAGHDRYGDGLFSGELRATIIARSPIHVASGLLEPRPRDRENPLVKALFRTNGRPAIPGTSLKGCIRSIVEAISPSAVTMKTTAPVPAHLQGWKTKAGADLDVTQRLFGMLGYQGNVTFADARLCEGHPVTIVRSVQLHQPAKKSTRPYFLDNGLLKGRKFYMHGALAMGNLPLEVIAEGGSLDLLAHFDNLTAGELGLLLIGLGLGEPRLWPKLGGAKPACLGTIEVSAPTLTIFSPHAGYADFAVESQPVALAPFVAAAHTEELILDQQLTDLAAILRWPREDRRCPDRNY